MPVDLIVNITAAVLTLIVLSRIIGDNPLFRGAQYLFVGVSLGYAFIVLYHQVLVPTLLGIVRNLNNPPELLALLMPLLLALLFLPRITRRQGGSWLAMIPLGVIFGVGAALALVGALVGTLVPQILATMPVVGAGVAQLAGAVVLAIGVIITLSYFFFTSRSEKGAGPLAQGSARAGRWLMMVTFGFFFAGALVTYLTALSERFEFLIGLVRG